MSTGLPFQDTNPDAILKKAKNGWYPIPDDFPPLARGAHLIKHIVHTNIHLWNTKARTQTQAHRHAT